MEQATEKEVPRSLGPLYVLLLSSSFDNLQNFSPNFANLKRAVSYFENLCTHFSGVYKPVEFWQLEDQATQTTKRSHGSSIFTLKEMEEATCSFSEKYLLGKGGFGRVYRGILRSGEISDFGLAKLMPEGQETFVTARVLGTFGYFDPEYTSTGNLTLQSDVYAFGVVLLELLTGRRAVDLNQGPSDQNLVLQVRHILNDRKKLRKVIDPELSRSSYTLESIAMFAKLASRCIRIESSERPSMAECVKELQTTIYINSKPIGKGMMTFKMV
ncbi:hypothetical protein D5086_016721 [Populus alba]|uniref:Uncharacterized protein n=1 Tax=Populus alba TaxID=43335 RepID=A0ACC4BUR8_POPAL